MTESKQLNFDSSSTSAHTVPSNFENRQQSSLAAGQGVRFVSPSQPKKQFFIPSPSAQQQQEFQATEFNNALSVGGGQQPIPFRDFKVFNEFEFFSDRFTAFRVQVASIGGSPHVGFVKFFLPPGSATFEPTRKQVWLPLEAWNGFKSRISAVTTALNKLLNGASASQQLNPGVHLS